MPGTDEGSVAERLAQARAQRRHVTRLRAAERRDAEREHQADNTADREAQTHPDRDQSTAGAHPGDEWRRTLLAEQAPLKLDRESLASDRDIPGGADRDL